MDILCHLPCNKNNKYFLQVQWWWWQDSGNKDNNDDNGGDGDGSNSDGVSSIKERRE